jgi:predicted kinase
MASGRAERDRKRAEAHALGVPIDLYYLNPPPEELWRRLHGRNQRGEHGTVPISQTDLHQWAGLFQAPDAAEFALFDTAIEVADARQHPLA